MKKLVKSHGINNSELINNLKDSKEIFKNKSAINFDVPTKGTTKKNARVGTTFFCSAAGVTAPVGLPMAGILGLSSAALGTSALTMTAANSAENYLRYRVSPTTSEKVSLVIGTAALGIGLAGASGVTSAIGTTAAEIGKVTSQGFTTGKNTFSATALTKATVDFSAQKDFKKAINDAKQNPMNEEIDNRIALSM